MRTTQGASTVRRPAAHTSTRRTSIRRTSIPRTSIPRTSIRRTVTARATTVFGAGLAVVALLALTACASNSSPGAASSSGAASGSTPGSAQSSSPATGSGSSGSVQSGSSAATEATALVGRTFTATEVTGSYTIVPGSSITLIFEKDKLSAKAGCNSMFGAYTVTGDVLTVPQMGSTMMACQEDLMAQDRWLAAFLSSGPTWALDGDTLTLTDGKDTLVLGPAPSGAAAVEGTGWKLDGLITQSGSTVSAVAPTVTAWVRFNAGEIAFNNSCNGGGGPVEIADSTMVFGPLRSTLIACEGAAGETEAAMNAVLQGTASYTVGSDPSGGVLTITAEDGATGLQFIADPTVGADAFPGAASSGAVSSGAVSSGAVSSGAVASGAVASPAPSSGG
jgi:heat shock protein HslJ